MSMNLSKFDSVVICASPLLMPYMFFIPGVSWCHPLFFLSLIFHGISGNISKSVIAPWLLVRFLQFYSCIYCYIFKLQELTGTLGFSRLFKVWAIN